MCQGLDYGSLGKENKMGDTLCSWRATGLEQRFCHGKEFFFTPTKNTRLYYNSFLLLNAYYVPNFMLGASHTLPLMLTYPWKPGEGYPTFHRRKPEGSVSCPSSHSRDMAELTPNLHRPNQAAQRFLLVMGELVFIEYRCCARHLPCINSFSPHYSPLRWDLHFLFWKKQ